MTYAEFFKWLKVFKVPKGDANGNITANVNVRENTQANLLNIVPYAGQNEIAAASDTQNLVLLQGGQAGGVLIGAGGFTLGSSGAPDTELASPGATFSDGDGDQVAIGTGATTTGSQQTAIGTQATVSGGNPGTAIGFQVTASGGNATAIGSFMTVAGDGAVGLGTAITAARGNEVKIGSNFDRHMSYSVSTTNATPAVLVDVDGVQGYALPINTCAVIRIMVWAEKSDHSAIAKYERLVMVRRGASGAPVIPSAGAQTVGTDYVADTGLTAGTISIGISAANGVAVTATGVLATNITWRAQYDIDTSEQ